MRPAASRLLVLTLGGFFTTVSLVVQADSPVVQADGAVVRAPSLRLRTDSQVLLADGQAAPAPIPPRPRGNLAPRTRTFTYVVEHGAAADGFRPGDRELATWALKAWERHSGGTLRFVETTEASPRIRLKWVGAKEGQYGETVRAPGNRRASIVYIRPDTDSLGPLIAEPARLDPLLRDSIVYLTCLHELGHAIGLAHTSDERDIMYSFQFGGDIRAYFYHYRDQIKRRADIAATSGLSENDISRIRGIVTGR